MTARIQVITGVSVEDNALSWAELWYQQCLEIQAWGVSCEHAEQQMWHALFFWAGAPCDQ